MFQYFKHIKPHIVFLQVDYLDSKSLGLTLPVGADWAACYLFYLYPGGVYFD